MYAQDAIEGPFAVKLENRLKHWRIAEDSPICDDMLAYVIAVGGTRPEEKAKAKS